MALPAKTFSFLCSDDDCGRYLGFKGNRKKVEELELNVEITVSPMAHDGRREAFRTISIKTRGNQEGAVEAAERVARLLVDRRSPGSVCTVQLLLDASQVASIVELGQHRLLALQTSLTSHSPSHCLHAAPFQVLEVAAPRDVLPTAIRVCAECAWGSGTYVSAPAAFTAFRSAQLLSPALPSTLPPHLQAGAAVSMPPFVMQGAPIGFSTIPPAAIDPSEMLRYLNASPTPLVASPSTQPNNHNGNHSGAAGHVIRFRLVLSHPEAKFLMAFPAEEEPSGKRPACRLQQLRHKAQHGCNLQLHDNKDGKKAKLRCLEISSPSTSPSIAPARTSLHEVLLLLTDMDPRATRIKMAFVVPKGGQAGAVIGRQGATIEGLRLESKADIKVAPEIPEMGSDLPAGITAEDEFVTVEGSPVAVLSALESIAIKLMGYQEKQANRVGSREGTPKDSPKLQPHSPDTPAVAKDPPSKRAKISPSSQEAHACVRLVDVTAEQMKVLGDKGTGILKRLRAAMQSVAIELQGVTSNADSARLEFCGEKLEAVDAAARLLDCFLVAAGVKALGPFQES